VPYTLPARRAGGEDLAGWLIDGATMAKASRGERIWLAGNPTVEVIWTTIGPGRLL